MDAVVISAQTYKNRRLQLARRIGDGALIIKSAPLQIKSRDAEHPYGPDKYLYYLTGCAEPNCALLMSMRSGRIVREMLLCRSRNAAEEQWDGERLGPVRARRLGDVAESEDIAKCDEHLDALLRAHSRVYFLPGANRQTDSEICAHAGVRRLQNRGTEPALTALCDVSAVLDEMRAVKDAEEIALLRHAAQVTAAGHCAAMRAAAGARNERELAAVLDFEFRSRGAAHAFSPIVASGKNACTLHYQKNNSRIGKDHLILIDAGAEWRQYAGDMSRTFPANGRFSPAQAALYDAVLFAQKRALAAIRPGVKWQSVEQITARALSHGLAGLKLCKGSAKNIYAKHLYRRFYMHRVGHFIGLDVHDVGRMTEPGGAPRVLRAGMVVTVEPGLYVPDAPDIAKEFRGMGVRIEDTVLVRRSGCEILATAPKTRAEIERWMRGG